MKYKIKNFFKSIEAKLTSDKSFVSKKYKKKFKRDLNLINPKSFNEKINIMKIDDAAVELSPYVDKFQVREFIKNEIGEQYLVDMFGAYDHFNREIFDSLPESFIIKGVHGVSMNYICRNKSEDDYIQLTKKLSKWLARNAYFISREKQYKNIKPRYIVEKLMQTPDGKSPDDYKFHCFNGEIKFVSIASSRFDADYSFTNYDVNGDILPFAYNGPKNETRTKIDIEKFKPIVEKLAKRFKFVRVDLYYFENQIKFGELTFTPFNGMGVFKPDSYDYEFGKLLSIEEGITFFNS